MKESELQAAYQRSEDRRMKLSRVLREILKLWDEGDLQVYSTAGTEKINTIFLHAHHLVAEVDEDQF